MTPISHLLGFITALQIIVAEPDPTGSSGEFLIIVNAQNQFDTDDDAMQTILSRLFLSDQKNWPNGNEVVVFSRSPESAEQKAFQEVVLRKSETELNNHWLKMKQVHGESPPRTISSSRILLRQINMKPDAVGIITKSDFDAHGHAFEQVEVLFSFDGDTDE